MTQRAYSKSDKQWLDAITQLGCIVCFNQGDFETPASPHHIDGRVKEGCHKKTIPLCGLHHQGGNNCKEYVSIHPHKAAFVKRYGSEEQLLEQCKTLIGWKT